MRTAIRVINLDSAIDRRESFTKQAKDAPVAWEFFPACKNAIAPLHYKDRLATRRFGRPLSAGEIGCYASHYKIWEWFLGSDCDQLIVLEDDVLVEWNIIGKLADYDFSGIGVDKLHLFTLYPFKSKTIIHSFLSKHNHLLRAPGVLIGSTGYLLTRRGAKLLLEDGKILTAPIDEFLARYWDHGVLSHICFPAPILEKFMPSTIGGARDVMPDQSNLLDRLVYKYWRARDGALRAWTQWFQMFGFKSVRAIDAETLRLHRLNKGKEV